MTNDMPQPDGRCGARTEVYSRVVGYFRPVQNWNSGKKAEFGDRQTYCVDASETKPEN